MVNTSSSGNRRVDMLRRSSRRNKTRTTSEAGSAPDYMEMGLTSSISSNSNVLSGTAVRRRCSTLFRKVTVLSTAGVVTPEQKALLKNLIIRGDEKVGPALQNFEADQGKSLRECLASLSIGRETRRKRRGDAEVLSPHFQVPQQPPVYRGPRTNPDSGQMMMAPPQSQTQGMAADAVPTQGMSQAEQLRLAQIGAQRLLEQQDEKQRLQMQSSNKRGRSESLQAMTGRDAMPTKMRRKPPRRWTVDEDKALENAVSIYNGRNWKAIAQLVPTRSHVQCLQRWKKVLRPGLVKGHWGPHEDQLLLKLIHLNQENPNWGTIASQIKGRTPKQCRERWFNHLDPRVKKGEWTAEEDEVIWKQHQLMGNRWSAISKLLPGRTENAVKIRWKSLDRKQRAGVTGKGAGASKRTSKPKKKAKAAAKGKKLLSEAQSSRKKTGKKNSKKKKGTEKATGGEMDPDATYKPFLLPSAEDLNSDGFWLQGNNNSATPRGATPLQGNSASAAAGIENRMRLGSTSSLGGFPMTPGIMKLGGLGTPAGLAQIGSWGPLSSLTGDGHGFPADSNMTTAMNNLDTSALLNLIGVGSGGQSARSKRARGLSVASAGRWDGKLDGLDLLGYGLGGNTSAGRQRARANTGMSTTSIGFGSIPVNELAAGNIPDGEDIFGDAKEEQLVDSLFQHGSGLDPSL
eukprot:g4529.t1